jgi:hypothetical protein
LAACDPIARAERFEWRYGLPCAKWRRTLPATLQFWAGLVDNKVGAIDDVWSGLRFVYRVTER